MWNKISIIYCFFLLFSATLLAQEPPKIKDIFDKYGKQEGSVLVQLSSDILSQGSNITFYKSLIIEKDNKTEQEILSAVKEEIAGKIIISEVKKSGQIESGSYYLGTKSLKVSEFILYKNKGGKITIVFLKGKFPSNNLERELKKLKDLFIYVNNKRLKIQ